MMLIKLAAYILAITVILTLASRVMWLLFILFAFRTWNALVPLDFVQGVVPFMNEGGYFLLIVVLAVGTYYLLVQLTKEIQWVRYLVLVLMTIWVFRNYSFSDVFFFKDWLDTMGLWGFDSIKGQVKEVFSSDPEHIQGMFYSIFETVFNWFLGIWEFIKKL